jgi:hypothetical protein
MKTYVHSWQYLAEFFSELKLILQVAEKIKTHILNSITSFVNCDVYEIRWKNKADQRWFYGACIYIRDN